MSSDTVLHPDAVTEHIAEPQVVVEIDGIKVAVPPGTLAIRAAEMIGIAIPRFCDHPLLKPAGACRQCMVEVDDMGNGRGMPKPQASCTLQVADGMKIRTQKTSCVAKDAQTGIMELLLINHPLDCPVCDKGGECPLQNQAMSAGRAETRYEGVKRTFPKPLALTDYILLDRERCVLCTRCTRFADEIAGDPFIALAERGAVQQVASSPTDDSNSYFSGNIVQICPVGALTSTDYRFQARPFDLISTPTTCEHCASGCALRVDNRHFQVKRRLAGEDPQVNEEWNCDKGRFAFRYGRGADRLTVPLVRRNGELQEASWYEAIHEAAVGLKAAADVQAAGELQAAGAHAEHADVGDTDPLGSAIGVITGGRLTLEDSYAYSKFARTVLSTNNIDFRARELSDDEEGFLRKFVAGTVLDDSVTFKELETAKRVVLVSFEAEEEAGSVFLRLRKGVRKHGLKVETIASHLSRGAKKLSATLLPCNPGNEANVVKGLSGLDKETVIIVGERAALSPGTLDALLDLQTETPVRMVWIPRRAGDRGAIETGCLPSLLPKGHRVDSAENREEIEKLWGENSIPVEGGLTAQKQLSAAASGEVKALVIAGVELSDFDHYTQAREGIKRCEFVVSIEQRRSEISDLADVVIPVSLIEERYGHFLNWESRYRDIHQVITKVDNPVTDLRALAMIARYMGKDLGISTPSDAFEEFHTLVQNVNTLRGSVKEPDIAEQAELDEQLLVEIESEDKELFEEQLDDQIEEHLNAQLEEQRLSFPQAYDDLKNTQIDTSVGLIDEVVLDTWRELFDDSASLDGTNLKDVVRGKARIKIDPSSAEHFGLEEDDLAEVSGGTRPITLPVHIEPSMVNSTVWIPRNSPGVSLSRRGFTQGMRVTLRPVGHVEENSDYELSNTSDYSSTSDYESRHRVVRVTRKKPSATEGKGEQS